MLDEGQWDRNMLPKEPLPFNVKREQAIVGVGWGKAVGSCYFTQGDYGIYSGIFTKM